MTFAQVRGTSPQPISDWFGVAGSPDPRGPVWNAIPTNAGVVWHAGQTAGHAPSGGESVTLTWSDADFCSVSNLAAYRNCWSSLNPQQSCLQNCWEVELSATLQPKRVASGLWYPSSSPLIKALDSTPTPGRWELLRSAAFGSIIDVKNLAAAATNTLNTATQVQETIDGESRFFGCGSETPLSTCSQVCTFTRLLNILPSPSSFTNSSVVLITPPVSLWKLLGSRPSWPMQCHPSESTKLMMAPLHTM